VSIEISDIRISVSQQYLDRNSGRISNTIPLAKFDEQSIPKDVSDDQKKAYLEFVSNLFNDAFTKSNSERTAVISGKFTTEENRDIGFIRSGESEEGRRTAREGYISIHGSTNIRRGSLWSVSEDEDKWGADLTHQEKCASNCIWLRHRLKRRSLRSNKRIWQTGR
jgi:hypothetical protein